jgi:hypothetical protein
MPIALSSASELRRICSCSLNSRFIFKIFCKDRELEGNGNWRGGRVSGLKSLKSFGFEELPAVSRVSGQGRLVVPSLVAHQLIPG